MAQASPPSAAQATPCPRCQQPLVDPRGLGWCQACGYCRSLAEDRERLPLAPSPAPAAAAAPSAAAQVQVPRWMVWLITGVVVIAASSWAVGRFVQLTPLQRALWTTIQAAEGVLIMFLSQSYALFRVAPEEATLHFVDALVPFRLYSLVFKRLPRLALVVCVGSWGLTLTLAAVLFIGGLGHWLNYLPKSQESKQHNPWR
jgi:hypothetical protein